MDYDFSQLNDKEFEILSIDLLSVVFGERIERFKPGKDAGVDGRFFSNSGKETVIQCKHYLKSGYRALIASAKTEAAKLPKLKPERYVFVTSLPLSRKNKAEIRKIFSPYIKEANDVFGQEDLNDILAQNPYIEEKHFKLWIASTNVLERLINNAIKGRSEYELERIRRNANKYVVTGNHREAIKILDERNVLIISGEPGIGKTTLAENICLYYVANGYVFVDIEDDLSDAEQVYMKGEKQIFYFDDFLGSNYLDAIDNKKDSHIVKFIDRVKNDNTKKFILTSRTNILNRGIILSGIFSNQKISKNEYLLLIQNLTNLEKAYILYNHIWHSNLNIDFIDEIYKDKRYQNIIKHKNYNPRLIEFITDNDRIDVSAGEYWDLVVKTLENPKDVWSNSFKIQSNVFVRNLVILTVFNGGRISEEDLLVSFNELNRIEDIRSTANSEEDFTSTAQIAVRSFLNRERTPWNLSYSLFNPSIADFILHEYRKNTKKLIAVYKSLYNIESLKTFISLVKGKIVASHDAPNVLEELFLDSFSRRKDIDYLIFLSSILTDDSKYKPQIIQLLNQIIESPTSISECSIFFDLLIKYKKDIHIDDFGFLLTILEGESLKYHDLESLMNLLEYFSVDESEILNAVAKEVENYLLSELNQVVGDNVDLSTHVVQKYIDDEEAVIEINSKSLFSEVKTHLGLIVRELLGTNFILAEQLDINYDNIVSMLDLDELRQEYINSLTEEAQETHSYGNGGVNIDNDIDDLFERSL